MNVRHENRSFAPATYRGARASSAWMLLAKSSNIAPIGSVPEHVKVLHLFRVQTDLSVNDRWARGSPSVGTATRAVSKLK